MFCSVLFGFFFFVKRLVCVLDNFKKACVDFNYNEPCTAYVL